MLQVFIVRIHVNHSFIPAGPCGPGLPGFPSAPLSPLGPGGPVCVCVCVGEGESGRDDFCHLIKSILWVHKSLAYVHTLSINAGITQLNTCHFHGLNC